MKHHNHTTETTGLVIAINPALPLEEQLRQRVIAELEDEPMCPVHRQQMVDEIVRDLMTNAARDGVKSGLPWSTWNCMAPADVDCFFKESSENIRIPQMSCSQLKQLMVKPITNTDEYYLRLVKLCLTFYKDNFRYLLNHPGCKDFPHIWELAKNYFPTNWEGMVKRAYRSMAPRMEREHIHGTVIAMLYMMPGLFQLCFEFSMAECDLDTLDIDRVPGYLTACVLMAKCTAEAHFKLTHKPCFCMEDFMELSYDEAYYAVRDIVLNETPLCIGHHATNLSADAVKYKEQFATLATLTILFMLEINR